LGVKYNPRKIMFLEINTLTTDETRENDVK